MMKKIVSVTVSVNQTLQHKEINQIASSSDET